MDDNARRRRQNEPPIQAASNHRYSLQDPASQRSSYGAGSTDRYRPAPLNTSAASGRGMGTSGAYSGYYQEPTAAFATAMPQSAMSYQSEYGQDTRQTQGFGAYNPSMMYNVPQSSAQNTVYDASQQFPSRQPAAMQMMSADVAAPYFPNETANNATAQALPPQAASSSTSSVYQQSPADQRAILQGYSGGMNSMSGMAQTSPPDQVMEETDYQGSSAPQSGEAYVQYQATVKEIFQSIRSGSLSNASDSLLSVSDWLLTKVVDLGLVQDDANLHAERIKMWNDFNHAWLAMCQRQKEMMGSGLALQRGQSVVSQEGLVKMGKELIRLCDTIERHGLVDYQYGVWEEQIETSLEECLDLYERAEEAGASGSTTHASR